MVIWSEPGQVLREIALRPGPNIVWSPDPAETNMDAVPVGVIGHGSGKTMFCRLLRYCLGEETFAPDGQRERIGNEFPEGYVGLDVVLDGVSWVIARPLGIRRRHFAVEGGDLDTVLSGEVSAAGVEPFLIAITTQVLTLNTVQLRRLLEAREPGWPLWPGLRAIRSAGSTTRSTGARRRRNSVRLFEIGIVSMCGTPCGHFCGAHAGGIGTIGTVEWLRGAGSSHFARAGDRNWEIDRLRERLLVGLSSRKGLSGGELDIQVLKQAATERFSKAAALPIGVGQPET